VRARELSPGADHRQERVLHADVGIAHFKGDLRAPHLHVAIAHQEPGGEAGASSGTVEDGEHRRFGAAGVDKA
jgi:hypothetical protein